MGVRKERTGWRDEELSRRHREWGFDCPAVDIDFVLLEFDNREPVALIEYKHEKAAPIFIDRLPSGILALSRLGTRADIPSFLVRYASDFSWYRVIAINKLGEVHIEKRTEMTENEYISFLYKLRGRDFGTREQQEAKLI